MVQFGSLYAGLIESNTVKVTVYFWWNISILWLLQSLVSFTNTVPNRFLTIWRNQTDTLCWIPPMAAYDIRKTACSWCILCYNAPSIPFPVTSLTREFQRFLKWRWKLVPLPGYQRWWNSFSLFVRLYGDLKRNNAAVLSIKKSIRQKNCMFVGFL